MSLIVEQFLAHPDPSSLVPWLADRLTNAATDAERLTAWIEPNSAALADLDVEEAFFRGLGGPLPTRDDQRLELGVPLLKYADGRPATTLLDAVLNPPRPRYAHFVCDVDRSKASEQNIIWIPAGASVVQLTVRNFTRDLMQTAANCRLVWF